MESFRGRYFQDALSAIERIGAAQSAAVIGNVIVRMASSFGYEHICFVASGNSSSQPFHDRVLWEAWPKQWAEQYRRSNFYTSDPVAPEIRRRVEMFAWSDVPLHKMSPASRRIMDIAAEDYDLKFGLCAPVHGLNGYQAGLSLAGREVERTREANAAIELVAMYASNRFAVLRAREQPKKNKEDHKENATTATRPVAKAAVLTTREREVMNWVAAGKTAWDTSVILSISEDTVNKTVTAAMHKLNAHTRAQAVAEAIKRGLIAY